MTKRLFKTTALTIAIAGTFIISITLFTAQRARVHDSIRFQAVSSMLIFTILGCLIGIVIGASLYRLIGRANGPRWVKTFLSTVTSLFIILIIAHSVGHSVVCQVLDWDSCSGGDCCFAEIGIAAWAGVTAVLFGAGLGQRGSKSNL